MIIVLEKLHFLNNLNSQKDNIWWKRTISLHRRKFNSNTSLRFCNNLIIFFVLNWKKNERKLIWQLVKLYKGKKEKVFTSLIHQIGKFINIVGKQN